MPIVGRSMPILRKALRRRPDAMRYLVLILLALAAAIVLGNLLEDDPGLMLFSYAGYTVQMSMVAFAVLLLIFFMLGYLSLRLLWGTWRLPRSIDRWSRHRRHRRAEKRMNRGVLAVLEGDWRTAEDNFRKGARYSSMPMVNYLAAARAAQQQKALNRRDQYLRLAHEQGDNANLALGLTQARLQLTQGQTEEAWATLNELAEEGNLDPQINTLLLEVASELGEWPQALQFLDEASARKTISKDDLRGRQLSVYAGILRGAESMASLEKYWDQVPARLKDEAGIIEAYIAARLHFHEHDGCEVLLRKALKKQWDESLVTLYGLVDAEKPARQLQFAEGLLKSHEESSALYLALGRLCKKQNLWGKAKSYLEASLSRNPGAEACQELALLLEQQGEQQSAAEYFRRGLALATKMDDRRQMPALPRPG